MTDYGFIRVSAGSQDAQTQQRDILAAFPSAIIVRPNGRAASASKGEQLDALDGVIAKLRQGDRVIVTDSSRLDRRDNLTSQVETMLAIRATGASIVSLAPGEETFANGDDLGSWVTTLVKQNANAEKSRTVKTQTWRGVQAIITNRGHYGALPMLWATRGERYGKQAYCADPATVRRIYQAVAAGESLQEIGRSHGVWPQQIKNLVRWEANHTGVIRCGYTYAGQRAEWAHSVTAVVDSALWWRANKVLNANATAARVNRGGRPVGQAANWLSGIFDCPDCGGRLFVNTGRTPAGNPRTPKLYCGGHIKTRKTCGSFKGMDLAPVIAALDEMFAADQTELLAYQRVTGNAHELDEMNADLARLQAQLSATEDDDELDALVARRKALRGAVSAFQLVPDTFAYAPVADGPATVAALWASSDDAKRTVVKAVKLALGLEVIEIGQDAPLRSFPTADSFAPNADGIVDLGGGICFRMAA
jgi:DNA invertase Pin-like site-specific DNA recombinase